MASFLSLGSDKPFDLQQYIFSLSENIQDSEYISKKYAAALFFVNEGYDAVDFRRTRWQIKG